MLWDHDTFGLNDFLGSVTLGIDDIRRTSMADEALFFPLEGVKSGSVELRIKVISEDAEVRNVNTKKQKRAIAL